MKERIDRRTDENLYQPKIHSERIRDFYALKLITGLPMTVLVDQAIREFIEINEDKQEVICNQHEGARTTEGTSQAEL